MISIAVNTFAYTRVFFLAFKNFIYLFIYLFLAVLGQIGRAHV